MNDQTKEIMTALYNLGIRFGNVRIHVDFNRAFIYVDESFFGIYDFAKKTFVD